MNHNGSRILIVTPQLVGDVFDEVFENFDKFYSHTSTSLPEPDLLYALLFQESTFFDRRVARNIRHSMFVNSLTTRDFPTVNSGEMVKIKPRASIAALYRAAVGSACDTPSVEQYLCNLFDCIREWPKRIAENNIDTTLENMTSKWMQIKISAAARAGHRGTNLHNLLHLTSLSIRAGNTTRMLKEARVLPPNEEIPTYTMLHSSRDEDGGVAMFHELNNLVLDDCNPCVIILAAPGECWDWALGMLGEPNETGERRICFDVYDNKGARAVSPKQGVYPQDMDQAVTYRNVSGRLAGLLPGHCLAQRGLGSTMLRNESLYVYMSTHNGASYVNETVRTVVMRGQDTKFFLSVGHSLYEAMKASLDVNTTNVVKYAP